MHNYDKLCVFIIFVLIFILIIYRNKSRYLIKEQFKTITNDVISNITSINKDLNNMTFENIHVLGNLTVNGNTTVKKNGTFKNDVIINGITTINDNTTLKNKLTANKESQFNNNVNIDKNKSLTSKNINTYILNPTNNCKDIKMDSIVWLSNGAFLDGNVDFKQKLTFKDSNITKQKRSDQKVQALCWDNPSNEETEY